MKTGAKERLMSLVTRLDGRSQNNNSFQIINIEGKIIAEISIKDNFSATLEITTQPDLHIKKSNGWTSKQN